MLAGFSMLALVIFATCKLAGMSFTPFDSGLLMDALLFGFLAPYVAFFSTLVTGSSSRRLRELPSFWWGATLEATAIGGWLLAIMIASGG